MFEKSKWIAKEDISEIKPAPLFRKNFNIHKSIKSATLNICGLGIACCYINGRPVSDEVLATPITKYDSRVIYNSYDVTKLLSSGKNTIGCILGNGWYFVTYWRWDYYRPDWLHHPKLIVQMDITYDDGSEEQIVSDKTWKTNNSAIIYNETRRGEIFDARLFEKNWNYPDYDDSGWQDSFICRAPGGIIQKNTTKPIRVTKRLKGVNVGNNVYDIGENISGWAKIKVRGTRGTEIVLRYSEVLHKDGTINPEQLNTILGSATHTDKYILSGDGIEEWSPKFVYHGFRYVEVTGAPDEFELTGEMIHTDFETVGMFNCSDDMLNKIHKASCQSTLTNFVGLPTDCPQREQNAWTGDAFISLNQTLMNYDTVASYKKWLIDIADTQRPNGQISCIAPTGGWGYNWGSGPAWDSVFIQLPYYIYYYTGDLSVVEQMWDNMVLYMEFMESMADNDLVDFGLGDWCPHENTDICPTVITDTAYFYMNNRIMARCAQLLEKPSAYYSDRADSIKVAFRQKFIEKDFYLNDNTCAIACCIYQDLYTDEEKKVAAKHLSDNLSKKGFHIDCGILGMKYIFSALSEYGFGQTLYKMVTNPEYPSYAYWINNGMTTLCEKWDMSDSCNHHMYSEVDMWLYKHVAGIHIEEGAKSVTIKPCFIDEIEWTEASHKGIYVRWDKTSVQIVSDIPGKVIIDNREIQFGIGEHIFSKIYNSFEL